MCIGQNVLTWDIWKIEQTTRASHKWEDANLYHKTRSDDPQLTEEGVLQAQSLANVLSQEHDLIEVRPIRVESHPIRRLPLLFARFLRRSICSLICH
jgi:broad specificity phosphatase PhoE